MKIAFYAPMKPLDHPQPSGDQRMARLLKKALMQAPGAHEVVVASRWRSWQKDPDPQAQRRQACQARRRAQALAASWEQRGWRPDLWFTYHCYYRAPDWLGPLVAGALAIPYVVAEASLAHKRRAGPWRFGHAATVAALRQAAAVIMLNPEDHAGVQAAIDSEHQRLFTYPPFLEPEVWTSPNPAQHSAQRSAQRSALRMKLAQEHGLDADACWLITVAMMRPGAKAESYRILAEVLGILLAQPDGPPLSWLIIGDGEARAQIEAIWMSVCAAAPAHRRRACGLRFLGAQEGSSLRASLWAGDLFLWPAINEAYGMAILEAQAAGLPVIAGRRPGVATIVADGTSGILLPERGEDLAERGEDLARNLAAAAETLIKDSDKRAAFSQAAVAKVWRTHDFQRVGQRLRADLSAVAS